MTRGWRIAAACIAVVAAVTTLAAALPAPAQAWTLDAVELLCALAIGARALRRPQARLAWALIALALLLWTAGDTIATAAPDLPVPSAADAGWLAFYVPAAAGLLLLLAARCRSIVAAVWLDGLIAGLAIASLGVLVVLTPVAGHASGRPLALAVNLAYPVGDIALVALAVLALAVGGWDDRPFLVLAAGLGLTAVADGLYLALFARGAWPEVSVLDALWPLATAVIAAAAWLEHPAAITRDARGLRQIAIPIVGGTIALGVILADQVASISDGAGALAIGAIAVAIARFSLTFAERDRAITQLRVRATTDPLTDLPNHREFHERLAAEIERARRHGRALSVAVLDLDHFKRVNDTFGHPTGDGALVHVAETMRTVARPEDTLARIGGEEFGWILPEADALSAWQAVERARRALDATPLPRVGPLGFSAGVCDLEHVPPPLGGGEMLRLADGALYWAKRQGRGATYRYTPEVVTALSAEEAARSAVREQSLATVQALARAVDARDPHTHQHSERVAALAGALAAELGWTAPRRLLLHEAALVHDIGKIGVPDEVLLAPGPLSTDQRALVEAHAAAGARIVAGALTEEQASWIRGHHERIDGRGYPDRLRGDAIPDGARIIAVADAYDAMTATRSYRDPVSPARALAACRAGAGTQFDPTVAAALERVLPRHPAPAVAPV